jgi:AraC-like DNA-binding protein
MTAAVPTTMSTDQMAPGDRVGYWSEWIDRLCNGLQCDLHADARFDGRMAGVDAGDMITRGVQRTVLDLAGRSRAAPRRQTLRRRIKDGAVRRVDACRGDFDDAHLAGRSITGIAMSHGFTSMVQFRRVFLLHAGASPSESRRERAAAVPPGRRWSPERCTPR